EFINKVVKEQDVDKILFVARDGYILKKVYDTFFHECANEYILFSRFCSEQIFLVKIRDGIAHHRKNGICHPCPLKEREFFRVDISFFAADARPNADAGDEVEYMQSFGHAWQTRIGDMH
ncbi:MAG: hypothetical protein ACI4PV_07065, partial [Butyricicoccus sp.]